MVCRPETILLLILLGLSSPSLVYIRIIHDPESPTERVFCEPEVIGGTGHVAERSTRNRASIQLRSED